MTAPTVPSSDPRGQAEQLVEETFAHVSAVSDLALSRLTQVGALVGIGLALALAELLFRLDGGEQRYPSVLFLAGAIFLVVPSVCHQLALRWQRRVVPSRLEFRREVLPDYLKNHADVAGWHWDTFLLRPWEAASGYGHDRAVAEYQRLRRQGFPRLARLEIDWKVVPGTLLVVSLLLAADLAISPHRTLLGWFLAILGGLFVLVLSRWPTHTPGLRIESAAEEVVPLPDTPVSRTAAAPPAAPSRPPPPPPERPRPQPAGTARPGDTLGSQPPSLAEETVPPRARARNGGNGLLVWLAVVLLIMLLGWQIGTLQVAPGETLSARLYRQFAGGQPPTTDKERSTRP
jgi:hypothetical protein